jgi:hypothetical protein
MINTAITEHQASAAVAGKRKQAQALGKEPLLFPVAGSALKDRLPRVEA